MANIHFDNVDKRYGDGTVAVNKLNLEIKDGEFLILVGPSGCGKTTALRMAAGLSTISSGELKIGGRVVNNVEARDRDIAMVFQNYALYPHMTIFDNIAFPLQSQKLPKDEIRKRVHEAAEILDLTAHLHRKPGQMSGGQRQRVAMGRAIVRRPQAFLMDEPLSNLDAKLRVQMRAEITRLQHDMGVTTLYVTHDQVEAMTMGDRIAVIRKGVLQQVGAPTELYERPANLFVAAFMGSPAMNLVQGTLSHAEAGYSLRIGEQYLSLSADFVTARGLLPFVGKPVVVGIRPEHFLPRQIARPEAVTVKGDLKLIEMLPPEQMLHFEIDADAVVDSSMQEVAADLDPAIAASRVHDGKRHRVTVVSRIPSTVQMREGPAEMAVLLQDLHFFDVISGLAIGERPKLIV